MRIVIIEGPDFIGKTTQVTAVAAKLGELGYRVFKHSALPKGLLRDYLLSNNLPCEEEILVLKAAALRVKRELEELSKSSDAPDFVIMDRGPQTFWAYQARTEELGFAIQAIDRLLGQPVVPDLDVRLWLTKQSYQERIAKVLGNERQPDSIESRGLDYLLEVSRRFSVAAHPYSKAKEIFSLCADEAPELLTKAIVDRILNQVNKEKETA